MSLTVLTPPAEEPVSLADIKLFLRIDTSDEDVLIAALGRAARTHVEAALSLVLVTQSLRLIRDIWPIGGGMDLPFGPVQALAAVTVTQRTGAVPVPLSAFRLDGSRQPPRLSWQAGMLLEPAPTYGGITIDFTAGFGGPAEVPEPIRQAIRLLAAHWYEQRGLTGLAAEAARIPHQVEALLAPYRLRRLA